MDIDESQILKLFGGRVFAMSDKDASQSSGFPRRYHVRNNPNFRKPNKCKCAIDINIQKCSSIKGEKWVFINVVILQR